MPDHSVDIETIGLSVLDRQSRRDSTRPAVVSVLAAADGLTVNWYMFGASEKIND